MRHAKSMTRRFMPVTVIRREIGSKCPKKGFFCVQHVHLCVQQLFLGSRANHPALDVKNSMELKSFYTPFVVPR